MRDGSAGGWGLAAAAMQIPANYCNTGPLPGHCISRSRRGRSYLGRAHEFHYYYFTENYSGKIIFHTRGPLKLLGLRVHLLAPWPIFIPARGAGNGGLAGVGWQLGRCGNLDNVLLHTQE